MSIFEKGLAPSGVNHIALSPLSLIDRTASDGHYPVLVHGFWAVHRDEQNESPAFDSGPGA